jgi:hypothetical protein
MEFSLGLSGWLPIQFVHLKPIQGPCQAAPADERIPAPKRCLGVSRDPAQADNFTRVSSKLTTGSYPLPVPSRAAAGMLIIVVMTGRRRKSKAGERAVLAISSRR